MRDALSLLDQAIAHGSGRVEETLVRDMLGTVDLDYLFDLLDALQAGDAPGLLRIADDMAGRSLSFEAALQELATLLTRIQVAQLAPAAIAEDLPERARLLDLAGRMNIEFVQLAYQIAVHGRQELALAPDEYAGFVMTLLRLLAFSPESADVGQAKDSPRTVAAVPRAAPLVRAPEASYRAVEVAPAAPVVPARASASEPRAPIVAVASAPSTPGTTDWHVVLQKLRLSGMARELAHHCELVLLEAGQIALRLAPLHRHLQMKPAQDKLQQALSDYFGRPLLLRIEVAETETATPAATAQKAREERQDKAVAAIEQDGFVRDVIEMFDAQLVESSIKPI
jgi:DNA polymerase-3 subunit gamma/tau